MIWKVAVFGGIKGTDNNCISPTAPQRLFQKKKRTGDLEKYISKRKNKSADFAKSFEVGYETFRIGFILRQARKELGITQEEVTRKLHAKKSAISHIENHAEDIRLSTLSQYAKALGRSLHVVMR